MKAYLGIKFHPDNRHRETIEIFSQALEACGFETVCIRRDVEQWGVVHLSPHELMTRTFEVIRSCHLVVIDLTEKGVGLGNELPRSKLRGIGRKRILNDHEASYGVSHPARD